MQILPYTNSKRDEVYCDVCNNIFYTEFITENVYYFIDMHRYFHKHYNLPSPDIKDTLALSSIVFMDKDKEIIDER